MTAQYKLDSDSNAKIRRMVELARINVEAGTFGAAAVYYRMILKYTTPPKDGVERLAHGEACLWFARRSIADKKVGTALDWYQQALRVDPLANDYRIEYCVKCLLPMNAYKNARIELERAIRIDPKNADAWRKLGGIEHAMGNAAAAVEAYDRALALKPDDPWARTDRATIALDVADYVTVMKMCQSCLRGQLEGDALHLMGMASYRQAFHETAIDFYDRAVAAGCHDPDLAIWHKSLALHAIGRYAEGWKAHEARGTQTTDGGMSLMMNRFTRPRWTGQPAPARVHVHQEMGHGDTIAMARYVSVMLDLGYEVTVEVNETMVALLQRSYPKAKVIAKAVDYPGGLGVPPFDYHVPMLSLPAIFKTEVETVPWSGPYLRPDSGLVEQYRARLPRERRKIGLCWSSGIRTEGLWLSEYGRRKSMPCSKLMKALNVEAELVSLQVGPERAEGHGLIDPLPAKPTWDDTASLIESLDLVITVDTSVAHMAGALGKPAWVMCQRDGQSWHWMCYRDGASWNERNPWYPTARVFRQHEFNRPHYWDEVVADVAAALNQWK